ncbi:hypothetical protein GCM10009814_41510 [Lapillicoccus jejuensis]
MRPVSSASSHSDRSTPTDVQNLVSGATSLGPAARRVLCVYVRAVFAAAVDDQLIPRSPCVRTRLPKVEPRPVTPLTVAQVSAIAEAMAPHLQGLVWLIAGAGPRPGGGARADGRPGAGPRRRRGPPAGDAGDDGCPVGERSPAYRPAHPPTTT